MIAPLRKRESHIWDRQAEEWYQEPLWCSERLFACERFNGAIYDPACGAGRIMESARRAGYRAHGSDIVRRCPETAEADFLKAVGTADNIVTNPPFKIAREFALHAMSLTTGKVAMIFPVRRLNALHSWVDTMPLRRVWLLTPRPSMPPGDFIKAGGKPGQGTIDFCWMVWKRGFVGRPEIRWLHRDAAE